ncbi:MAG: DinB family protein [Polaribacter sp.]|uniref:DinB family protein n=1 Tax=Polaribacter sp. TaxID=1920175 RepID=UPI003BB0762C
MINAIEKNLQRGIHLLKSISDDDYANTTIPPYYSSIGCHMRHILDVFSCVLNGFKDDYINLTKRERNELVENKTAIGIAYFEDIINQLKQISSKDLDSNIKVTDDLGLGKVTANYTLAAILMQAQSHAIHHFASVGYVIHQLGIELPDEDFGLNSTSLKKTLRVS